jgi:hypothetical protein
MLGIKDKVYRLVPFLPGSAAQRCIEDELRFHIEMRTQENMDSGMAPTQARQDAEERFGNVESIKSDCLKIHFDNHVAMKALNCLLLLVVAFGLVLRLTSSTTGIRPTGDLIVISAILLRLLIHLRLKSSLDLAIRMSRQREQKGSMRISK